MKFGFTLILTIALVSACGETQPPEEQAQKLPTIEAIQSLTTRECECRMAGIDSTALQRRIETLTVGLDAEGFGTASDPVTYSSTCYPELGKTACTMTYANLVEFPEAFVCTAEQSEEVEAIWDDALADPYGPTTEAERAAKQRIETMRDELRAALHPGDCQ